MTHTMNLDPSPFGMIKSGIKTIELRLYDEKRRLINAGDTIVFTSTENSADTLEVRSWVCIYTIHLKHCTKSSPC